MSKIQVIRDEKNKPVSAIVPWNDYVELAGEDEALDALMIDKIEAARQEQRFPLDIVKRILDGESQIKVFREWRGMTQAELAKKSGLAKLYISQLETGHRKIGGQAAKKLAPALDIGIDVLLDDNR
jgi:DNA-binding XRE family transcriptional regulator